MTHCTDHRIDTEALLARMPLFADLRAEHIALLADHARGRRMVKGEMLFQKGDPAHGFFIVIYGQVKLAFPASNGNEKVVDIINAQQSFGEAVMLAQQPYPVFAQVLVDTLLLQIGREAVFKLLEQEPAFARRMLIGLAMHNHSLVSDIESYTQRTSSQRVMGYLLQHCPVEATSADTIEIVLPTAKQITASRLNLTPETLSRIFHDLMDAGLIDMEGKRILIHSIRRLREASTDAGVATNLPGPGSPPAQRPVGHGVETHQRGTHLPATTHRKQRVSASW